jgi:uncharacterized membrane protein YsdA (DUF1294 family)
LRPCDEPAIPILHSLIPLGAWYAIVSFIAFAVYAHDKTAARQAAHRTPESTLHLLALSGGWPGALLAQQLLRHKTRKTSFLAVFWLTVIVNCGMLLFLLHMLQGG